MMWLIIILALGIVISAWLLIKQSAKKFQLNEQQLKDIKKRNQELDRQEQKEDDY